MRIPQKQRLQPMVSALPFLCVILALPYLAAFRPMGFVCVTSNHQTMNHVQGWLAASGFLASADDPPEIPDPVLTSFREAEVLGLKYMQEGDYEQAVKLFQNGLKLSGNDRDIVRTKSLSGPSPVGGSMGGFESQDICPLDEFELQAAYYNIACAQAQLGNVDEAIENLQKSFENGFNNISTIRSDPDLDPIKNSSGYKKMMDAYDSKAFNPFGFFGKTQ